MDAERRKRIKFTRDEYWPYFVRSNTGELEGLFSKDELQRINTVYEELDAVSLLILKRCGKV